MILLNIVGIACVSIPLQVGRLRKKVAKMAKVIICDRCGKRLEESDITKSISISRQSPETGNLLVTQCEGLKLTTGGMLSADIDIDLCDACKESFASWYGKVGIYEK